MVYNLMAVAEMCWLVEGKAMVLASAIEWLQMSVSLTVIIIKGYCQLVLQRLLPVSAGK